MIVPSKVSRGTVLIVDDEDGVRHVMRRSLESEGYDVLLASSASEAVVLFQARGGEILLIVADVRMPAESGPQMIRRLAELGPLPPVLYVSGYADDRDMRAIADQGAPFLPKPFLPEALACKVRELIES